MQKLEITLAEDSHLGRAGQKVTLELTPADVSIPQEIPTYLAGFRNWQFRADDMSKVILVDQNEDKFRSFSSDDAFEPVKVKGAINGSIPEVDPRSALDSYKLTERYIGSFVNDITAGQVRNTGLNPLLAAGKRCQRALDLDRELDVLGPTGLLTTSTNFAAAQRLALGADENFNGGTLSDPIKAIQTMCENSAQPVTEVWMNYKVSNGFIRHDKVRDHMRQMLGDTPASSIAAAVSNAALQTGPVDFVIPGLPPIRVAASKYKNTSGSIVQIMPDVVVGLCSPPGQPTDGEDIATSYTFRRRGPSGVGIESREFRIENRGPQGGTMVVISMSDTPKMTGNSCGGIITGVWA